MSIHVASPLRQRMIEDMTARQLGPASQRSHIYSCQRFAAFLKRSPDTATIEDIRRFQLHVAETGTSICNRNRIIDPVPIAMAAWCHGQRAGHHFTAHREAERRKALELASNASALAVGDPLAHAMLSAAFMLAHDLTTAEAHARQALAIDGGRRGAGAASHGFMPIGEKQPKRSSAARSRGCWGLSTRSISCG